MTAQVVEEPQMSAEEKFMALFGGGGGMASLMQSSEPVSQTVQVQNMQLEEVEIHIEKPS